MHNDYNERNAGARDVPSIHEDTNMAVKAVMEVIDRFSDEDRGGIIYKVTNIHLDMIQKKSHGLESQLSAARKAKSEFLTAMSGIRTDGGEVGKIDLPGLSEYRG